MISTLLPTLFMPYAFRSFGSRKTAVAVAVAAAEHIPGNLVTVSLKTTVPAT